MWDSSCKIFPFASAQGAPPAKAWHWRAGIIGGSRISMKLIVGLGNPGEKYTGTRHNLGFLLVEHLLRDVSSASQAVWSKNEKLKSEIATLPLQARSASEEKILLAKPLTYMNNSGMAVLVLREFYKIPNDDIWVVHDELDLPLGAMKIRFGGAAAGHHGVESIIEKLGTDKFWRFRMGIGDFNTHEERSKIHNAEAFVLGQFETNDQSELKQAVKKGTDALRLALDKDIEHAMNRFNTK